MVDANFEINNTQLNADFEIDNNSTIEADFAIYAAGTTWGNISGDIENQTDLINALNAKQDVIEDLDSIRADATLGSTALQPNDNITELVNNAGYLVSSDLASVAMSGEYSDLLNAPTIGDGNTTITVNNTSVGTITANQTTNNSITISVPTTASEVGALPSTTTINDLTSEAQQSALDSGVTSTIVTQVGTNAYNISNLQANKQDNLNAGANIQINGNTISATNTTYSAGDNVTITNGTISATDTTYSAGANITINNGTISAVSTSYIAGNGINISGGTISVGTTIASKTDIKDGATTILVNSTSVGTITANQTNAQAITINVPTTATEVGALPSTTTINDLTSTAQQDALNSGVTSTIVSQVGTSASAISTINSYIPSGTSASNPLTNEYYVNNAISANTANFIGTFNSVAELEAYSGTLTNNDYAFVATTDSAGNTLYDRYKWNGTEWLFEYEINNSSFTSDQWAAINSGITDVTVTQIASNTSAITGLQTSKQDTLTAGDNITISGGTISASSTSYSLPIATTTTLGGIKVGTNLTIASDGTLSSKDTTYTQGNGINISGNTISVSTTIASKTDIGTANLTIQCNGVAVGSFSANATSAETINISVPTTATEVDALPSSTIIGDGAIIFQKNSTSIATISANQTSTTTVDFTIPVVTNSYSASGTDALNGVAISGAKFLQNKSTSSTGLVIEGMDYGTAYSNNGTVAIGKDAIASANSIAIGQETWAAGQNSVSIGGAGAASNYAISIKGSVGSSAGSAIQLGFGTNNTPNTFNVGFYNNSTTHYNYQLLDGATGLIPDGRISTAIARATDIPTNTNQLSNGAGFITGINSGDVTTALGYTPYNSTNPSGYITSSDLSGYQLIAQSMSTASASGTVSLTDNTIYKLTATGNVTFSLPSVSDTAKLHQIFVQLNMSTARTISVGTTYYFNKTAPDLSAAGTYNLYWEYDNTASHWVCGCISKGASS